jgi:hypothetical protein
MLTLYIYRCSVSDILSSLKLVFLSLRHARQVGAPQGDTLYKVTIEEVRDRSHAKKISSRTYNPCDQCITEPKS